MSSVFLAQVIGFLNSGDASNSYKEVIRVGRDIKMKSDEFEVLLDAIFDIPPVSMKSDKNIPVIMITTGKSETQKKNGGMKEWARFRRQSCFNRRLVNALEEVLMEDPKEEEIALQKAFERSGLKSLESPSIELEKKSSVLLQPGVSGLWGYPGSDAWATKPNEIAVPKVTDDWSSAAYLPKEDYQSSFELNQLASHVTSDPYDDIYWDNFVNFHVTQCIYTLDNHPSLYMQSDPYLVLSFPVTLAHFLSI